MTGRPITFGRKKKKVICELRVTLYHKENFKKKKSSVILHGIVVLQFLELGPKTYKSPRFLQLYGKLEQELAEM